EDLQVLIELAREEEHPESYEPEVVRELEAARAAWAEMEMANLLGGEHDEANAIMEVNAGAGGTEACDWAQMLLRMYLRWAERRGCRSIPTTCASTPFSPAAPAARTCRRTRPRSGSRTSRPGSWSPARTSARSSRTARRR